MEGKTSRRFRALINMLVTLVLVAAALLTMVYYQKQAVERSRERAYVTLRDSAAEQINTVRTKLGGQFTMLETLGSSLSAVESVSEERTVARMAAVVDASEFASILLADAEGNGVNDLRERFNVSSNWCFSEAMDGRRAIQRIDGSKYSLAPHFILAVPLTDGESVTGALLGSYDVESFCGVIISEAYSGEGFSFICDGSGAILTGDEHGECQAYGVNFADTLDRAEIRYSDAETSVRENLAASRPGLVSYSLDGMARYAAYVPLDINDWMLFNVVPAGVVDAEVSDSAHTANVAVLGMTGIAAILIFIIILTTRQQARRLMREQERLRASEKRFSVALKNSSVSIREYDPRTRMIYDTTAGPDGKPPEPCSPEKTVERGLVCPEDAEAYIELFKKLDAGESDVEGVFRTGSAASGWRYDSIHYTNLLDDSGRPYRAIGTYEDVTEKHMDQLSYEQELNYQRLAASDMYASALLDVTERTVKRQNYGAQEDPSLLENVTFDRLMALNSETVVSDEEVRSFFKNLTPEMLEERFQKGQPASAFEYLRRMGDGSEHWVRDECHLLREPATGHLMAFLCLRDIDSDRRRLESLEHAAETDSMTGFFNHNAVLAHIENFLSLDGGSGVHALYMLDIDNFKQVNDTFGHQMGDECIITVAESLRKIFRSSDIFGRIGGDEFLVLMKNVTSAERVRTKAQEVVDQLQFAYTSAGASMQVSVSLGVNVITSGGRVGEMVAQADAALYTAKKEGKHRYSITEGSALFEMESAEPDAAANRAGLVQLQALLEYMDSGVELLELADEIRQIYVSPGFCRMMGVRHSGYTLPRPLRDVIVHPDDLPDFESALRQGEEWGNVVDHVYRNSSDGTNWHWRHTRAVRIPYESSEYPVLISVTSDIDKLKKQEAELDFNEQRYRTALSKTGATVWELDLRTGEAFRSGGGQTIEKAVRKYEGGAEALLESGLIHPDSVGEFNRMLQDVAAGNDSSTYSLLTKSPDGEYRWNTARFATLRDGDGKPYYAIGVLERYQAPDGEMLRFEQELRISGEVAGMLKAMCRVDLTRDQTEFLSLNDGQYTNSQPEKFSSLQSLLPEFLGPEEDRADYLVEVTRRENLIRDFREGVGYRALEFRRLSSDGSSRWTSCAIVLARHPVSGDVYGFGYMRDIDVRRRWELESGLEIKRDEESFLYTSECARALIESVLSHAENKNALCALCVIELSHIDEIRQTMGEGTVSATIRSVGRLLRMLTDDGAIVGRLDTNHALIFRAPIESAEEQLRRSENTNALVSRMSRLARVDFNCRLITGFDVSTIGEMDYDAMLERAHIACRRSGERAARSSMPYAAEDK